MCEKTEIEEATKTTFLAKNSANPIDTSSVSLIPCKSTLNRNVDLWCNFAGFESERGSEILPLCF